MPKYRIYAAVTGGKYLGEFEGATEEDAIKEAANSEAAFISLCHQCSKECEDPEVHKLSAELIS